MLNTMPTAIELDHVRIANKKALENFADDYLPPREEWTTWIHPVSKKEYSVTLQKSSSLSADDMDSCFRLIELTNSEHYKRSNVGWKPKAKRKEMRLLDLKYLLIKHEDQVNGFCSFMPTEEDEYFVVYCYEIHLAPSLQGTGLGKYLMNLLDIVSKKIPNIEKLMLTCFVSNARAVQFYRKLGFEADEFSPPPRILRNGTKVECDYIIMSKEVHH